MGLDISNDSIDSLDSEISGYIDQYLSSDYTTMFFDYLDNQEYEKILNEVTILHVDRDFALSGMENFTEEEAIKRLNMQLDEFKESVQRIMNTINLVNNIETTNEDREIARKYSWVYDDDTHDSRMGSYGTLHYGRKFADLVEKLYESKGLDIETTDQELTLEEVETLIVKIEEEGTTSYNPKFFDNLCNHADCEGIYIPIQSRNSFDVASSILLLKELDALCKVKALERLKSIMEPIEKEYGKETINYAPQEIVTVYYTAYNCEWVIRKMLYHAVSSVENDEIICFC